jgi:hypothetical protein
MARKPGSRRSPRHERMSLVVEIIPVGSCRLISDADYHFPNLEIDTHIVDVPIPVCDEDTGPRTQVCYLPVIPRLPARKT